MIAIIGAGISGLTLAWHLQQAGKPYVLLESSEVAGGYIKTALQGPYQLELGPNSLLADTETQAILEKMGLASHLVPSNPVSNSRFIYRYGAYQQLPAGPGALLTSNFFSLKARIKIIAEFFNKSRGPENESLTAFFTRRFGPEVVQYALDPFVTGIYAGDTDSLLVKETFPQLVAMEQQYGSVLKGFVKTAGNARRKSVNFIKGMQTLTNTLAGSLHNLKAAHTVQDISKTASGFTISGMGNNLPFAFEAQKVVISVPAYVARNLLGPWPALALAARNIVYPPMIAVHTAFKKKDVKHPLNGFGGLNPSVEKKFCAGSIWTSSVFNHCCPDDEVLLTSFVGGIKNASHTLLPDDAVLKNVLAEVVRNYGITGPAVFTKLTRWPMAIPQYDQNLSQAKLAADKVQPEGLYICANWLGGISLSDCIKKAGKLAEQL
jgi:protoporphyrinogen/coproporphyrinogen III oxidase